MHATCMRKWLIIFIIAFVALSGCLEAKLTAGEVALCMHAANGELTRIPTCTTANACHASFRKTQPIGTGNRLGVATLVGRAEDESIRGWLSANAAAQELEKLKKSCQTGKLGNILGQARQAGNELSSALARSEKSQVWALEAIHLALKKAEELELDVLRDSRAFHTYAQAVELVQELQTGQTKSELAQKIQNNKNYFASAATALTGKESNAYSVDIASGFDLLKTPIKILEPGNKSKLIIAFFPVWESFLNSVRTRKNAAMGLRALEGLQTDELIRHLEQGLAPTQGIHAGIIQQIHTLEEGILELEAEEQQTLSEENNQLEKIQEKTGSLLEIIAAERVWRMELEKWSKKGGENTIEKIENEIKKVIVGVSDLQTQRRIGEELTIEKKISLGKRIQKQRERIKILFALEARLAAVQNELHEQENKCVDLANKIRNEKVITGDVALAAKEVYEAKNKDVARYCQNLMQKLELASKTSGLPQDEVVQKNTLSVCVDEVNRYLEALAVADPISLEQWLVQNNQSIAMANNTCQAARLNLETTYAQNTQVRTLKAQLLQIEGIRKLIEQLLATAPEKSEKEKFEKLAETLLAEEQSGNKIYSQKELIEKNEKLKGLMISAKKAAQEGWQTRAEKTRWKIISPAVVTANQSEAVVSTWELKIPHQLEVDGPMQLTIVLPAGLEVMESNGAWEQEEKIVYLRYTTWPQRVWIKASGQLQAVSAEEKSSWGEVIGNEVIVHSEIKITSEFPGVQSRVKWMAISGFEAENTYFHREHSAIPIALSVENYFLVEVEKVEEKILAEGTIRNAIKTTLSPSSRVESESTTILKYLFTLENKLRKNIHVTGISGLRVDPIETIGVAAIDESGKTIPWTVSVGGTLVVDPIEIPASGKRTITLVVTQLSGSEAWESQWNALKEGLTRLTSTRFGIISSKALTLLHRMAALPEKSDPAQWAELLPKWQLEYENLLREENLAWQRLDDLTSRKKKLENSKNKTSEWNHQFEIAVTGIENGNLDSAATAIEWLEKNEDQSNTANTTVTAQPDWQMIKKEYLSKIIGLGEKLTLTVKLMDDYAKEQSITCAKLLEINFICPLSENQLKDLKVEWNEIQKNNRALEKAVEKVVNGTNDWGETSTIHEKNETQLGLLKLRIEKAQASLSESARETQRQVNIIPSTGKEWDEGVQKMVTAMEKNEYGKAIYLGRNLLNYASGQKSTIAGLSIIPEKTWPLAGVIVTAGGIGIFHWWKKKNTPRAEPKSIPKGGQGIILPQSPERAYDESSSPSTKREFPPEPLIQTKP